MIIIPVSDKNRIFPDPLPEEEEEDQRLQSTTPAKHRSFTQEDIESAWPLGRLIMERMNDLYLPRSTVYKQLGIPRGYFENILHPLPGTNIRFPVIMQLAEILDIPLVELLSRFWPEDTFLQRRLPLVALILSFLEMDQATQESALTFLQMFLKQGRRTDLDEVAQHERDRLIAYPSRVIKPSYGPRK